MVKNKFHISADPRNGAGLCLFFLLDVLRVRYIK